MELEEQIKIEVSRYFNNLNINTYILETASNTLNIDYEEHLDKFTTYIISGKKRE